MRVATITLGIALLGCQRGEGPVASHYHDPDGRALTAYEPVWQQLYAQFGAALPEAIEVDRFAGSTSRFDAARHAILVAEGSLAYQTELGVVAHESTHLALAALTADASTEDQLRFVDEGLATVVEREVEGNLAAYRRTAEGVVRDRGHEHIAELEQWSVFFGHASTHADWKAYDVAADFVLFVEDRYGRERFARLLTDLAHTRAFDPSCIAVLGVSAGELEQQWWARP